MRARRVSAAAVLFVASLGCEERTPTTTDTNGSAEPGGSPWFEDLTETSGIDFLHTSGKKRFWYPEIFAGGVLLLDYDGDGLLDVYLVQAAKSPRREEIHRGTVCTGTSVTSASRM